MELERIALSDPYFKDRKLYPNVDFYSGLIYKAMGFPTGRRPTTAHVRHHHCNVLDMFPILFTVPRLAGWLAHWSEWIDDPENRIYRPFQVIVLALLESPCIRCILRYTRVMISEIMNKYMIEVRGFTVKS